MGLIIALTKFGLNIDFGPLYCFAPARLISALSSSANFF